MPPCMRDHGDYVEADVRAHGCSHVNGGTPLCWEHVQLTDGYAHSIAGECGDVCVPLEAPAWPMVSVLTPTWRRPGLLREAINNVYEQDYPGTIEHVIVGDGPDSQVFPQSHTINPQRRLRAVQLGTRWTEVLTDSYAAAPMMVAQLLASGDVQMWLADDERIVPHYVRMMVAALHITDSDMAYPRSAYYTWKDPQDAIGIGADPPVLGSITTIVYSRHVLELAKGPYRTHVGRENDWDFIKRALEGGARYVFVDRVIHSHRDDRGCPPGLYDAPLPGYANA